MSARRYRVRRWRSAAPARPPPRSPSPWSAAWSASMWRARPNSRCWTSWRPGCRRCRRGAGLARLADAHPDVTLRIEPGRALTAYCGWYVTEVLDVKHSHGEEFAVLRGGTHHLRTPATKGHDQPCVLLPVDAWPHAWPRS